MKKTKKISGRKKRQNLDREKCHQSTKSQKNKKYDNVKDVFVDF
jgi:hypothetical protein